MNEQYQIKRTKLITYHQQFSKLKSQILNFKWILELNVEAKDSVVMRRKLAKLAKLMFDIEHEFVRKEKK